MNKKSFFETTNEDTVQCLFFSTDKLPDSFEQKCKDINSTIETLSYDYIWHKDQLKVHLPIIDSNDVPQHLASTTSFGDNIEDEWFIVYLVLEITKIHPDMIIQIKDNDGDFLLIEAADYLPQWINPENSENRVFIYNNHIHFIPPELAPLEERLEVGEAINYLTNSPDKTKMSNDCEQAILSRIGNYPKKLQDNIHSALIELPVDIAIVLSLQPKLIAPIVNAYCSHDVIDAKHCKNIKYENCVTYQTKFTKCLYAMLMHSKVNHYVNNYILGYSDKKRILGLKLTCGFHMIMKNLSSDIFNSRDFTTFVNNLKEHCYFKNNIKGSKEYNQLLDQAKDFYSSIVSSANSQIAHEISELISSDIFLKEKESFHLKQSNSDQVEDNDEWLNIHPEQLNELLNKRYGEPKKFKNDDVISSHTVTAELSKFLKQTSDFEGIETSEEAEADNVVDFDANEFTNCLEKMLQLVSTDGIDSDSSDESDNFSQCDMNYDLDEELVENLQKDPEDLKSSQSILFNIIKSMKEEKAASGPSSNLLTTIGLKKTDLFDSDDD